MDSANATEAELLAASRRGERAAFGRLVERCAQMVAAVSYARTGDRTLSEDITQDTFVVAWRELPRLREATALRPWLCGIARNLAHKARRRRAREISVEDPDVFVIERTAFDAVHRAELERTVAAALAAIPGVYREALVLFYYEQRSAKDVAAALGVGEDVVHKRLSRGRRNLAASVQKLVETELERRRSRRDLAGCVLALLPIPGPIPRPLTKGISMWKLSALGMTAAVVSLGTTAASSQAEPVPQVRPAAAPAPRISPVAPAPRLPAVPVTCSAAVQHILDVALDGHEAELEGREARIEQVEHHLEGECRDEQWSQSELGCFVGADTIVTLRRCRTKPHVTYTAPVVDLGCKSVGKHVADLMIANLSGTQQDNVLAAVLEDTEELPAGAEELCISDEWSEPLRRCYAAATQFKQVVICNLADD